MGGSPRHRPRRERDLCPRERGAQRHVREQEMLPEAPGLSPQGTPERGRVPKPGHSGRTFPGPGKLRNVLEECGDRG